MESPTKAMWTGGGSPGAAEAARALGPQAKTTPNARQTVDV
jgi:hypothetical protein